MMIFIFAGEKFLPEYRDWCEKDSCADYKYWKEYFTIMSTGG